MLPQFFRDGSMNVPVMIPDAFLPWPEALVYKKCGCWVGWEIGHAGSRRKAKQLSRHIICIPFFMLPREAMPNPCSLQLRRQIRALQQKKRRLSSAQKKTLHASSSPRTLLVFHFSSFQPEIVADFLLGRGQSKLQLQPPDLGAKNAIVNDVKSGFEQEMAQCGPDPTAWAHVTPKDNVVACRYVVEHRLCSWLRAQNFVHGVAPSRSQIMEQGPKLLPTNLPAATKSAMEKIFAASARTQRKWLASFRRRWHARIGMLRVHDHVPPELRNSKVPRMSIEGIDPNFGEPIERLLCTFPVLKMGPSGGLIFGTVIVTTLLFSFPTTLADPFLGPPGGPIFGTIFDPNFAGRGFFPLDECSCGRCAFRAAAFAHQHGRDLAGISLLWTAWDGIEIAD